MIFIIAYENSEKHINKFDIHNQTSESVTLGILLSIVGGFLDSYTFLCRGGVFANAQTGNLVLVAIAVTKRNILETLTALLPILAFVAGVLICEWRKKHHFVFPGIHSKRAILILEVIVLLVVGLIPTTAPNLIVTVAISFVSSLQIASFRKLSGTPYSTAMCTGNLRSACEAFYTGISSNNSDELTKSLRYGTIIITFIIGALLGAILTSYFNYKSIWFCVFMLIVSIFLFTINEYKFKKSQS